MAHRPVDPEARTTRRYLDDSFVLETTHETSTGVVRVLDVMPLADGRADVLRRIEGVSGTVRMRHEWIVRFSYGRTKPFVSRHTEEREAGIDQIITAVAGPDMIVLRGARLPRAEHWAHVDEFDVAAGEKLAFATTWFSSFEQIPPPLKVIGPHRRDHRAQPPVGGPERLRRPL